MTSQQTESPQFEETRKNLVGTGPAGKIPTRARGVCAERAVVEFRVSRPGMPLRRLRLGGARYTFGSGPESSIRLDDPSLESTHALLTRDGGRVVLRSTSTPIAVNGRAVTSTWLVSGDHFQLGQFDFELITASASPAAGNPQEAASPEALAPEAPAPEALAPETLLPEVAVRETAAPETGIRTPSAPPVIRRRLSFADSFQRTPVPSPPTPPLARTEPESASKAAAEDGSETSAAETPVEGEPADDSNAIAVEGRAADHRAILANERRWQEKNRRQLARQRRREAEHRKQIEALLAAHAEAERRAGESEQAVLEVREQLAELSQQVATLTQTAGPDLDQRLKQQSSAAVLATQQCSESLETLRDRLDSVQEMIDGVQREASDIREQTVSVREDQREVLANAELLEKMILRLSESRDLDRAGQSLELNEMRESLRQLSSKLSHTSGQLSETQESSQTLSAEVEQLRSSLLSVQSDHQRFATIEQIDAVEDQLRVTDARLTELVADYDSQAVQLRQECELLRQRIEGFEQAAAEKFAALEEASRYQPAVPQPTYPEPRPEELRPEELRQEEPHWQEADEVPPVWSSIAPAEEQEEQAGEKQGGEERREEAASQADDEPAAAWAASSWSVPSADWDSEAHRDSSQADTPIEDASEWDQPSADQTMMWTAPPGRDASVGAEAYGAEDESEPSRPVAAAPAGPRSAAEILASMGMAYGDDEEVDESPTNPDLHAPDERLAAGDFASSAAGAVSEECSTGRIATESPLDAASEPPDEDSIEAYMNRLLQRVQGGSTGASTWPSPAIPQPVKSSDRDDSSVAGAGPSAASGGAAEALGAAKISAHASGAASASLPNDSTPLIPRSQAPERTSNLAAMRELANNSARSAIAQSVRKRMVHQQFSKYAFAGVALLTGGAILFASEFRMDHWLLAACCCFCLAMFFLIEGLNLRKRLRETAANSDFTNLGSPEPAAADTDPAKRALGNPEAGN